MKSSDKAGINVANGAERDQHYQVLYRKWRSQTFSEIYGQPFIVTALKNEVLAHQFAHAYLFTGSRGTGKTSCAKILSKAVNCLNPSDGDPCNQCDNCVGINNETILDVTEIDAASNNGVDSIRDLREEVNFAPSVAKYRVYIIDEVHMLSAGAFNALLKTLEEPPAHAIFILATTEVHKLPPTILSRCQRYDFKRISSAEIARRIHYIGEHEGFTITDDAALLLSRLADGGMRDALSMLDQCIASSRTVDEQVVIAVAGIAGNVCLKDLSGFVVDQNAGEALELINKLHHDSKDMARLCFEWLEYFRDLMIIKSVPNFEELVTIPPSELGEMKELCSKFALSHITHCMDVLQDATERIRFGVSRRIEMELAVIKLCSPKLDGNQTALLRRIEALERAVKSGISVVSDTSVEKRKDFPAPAISENTSPFENTNTAIDELLPRPSQGNASDNPPQNTSQNSVDDEEDTPFHEWVNVMEVLATACPPLYGVLEDATAVVRGGHMLIETNNPMFKVLASKDVNRKILAKAVRDIAGKAYRIGVKKKAENQTTESDPLSDFIKSSQELGVDITIN